MSRERKNRRQQTWEEMSQNTNSTPKFAAEENTLLNDANTVVLNHESHILNTLSLLYLRFKSMGLQRQAAIVQGESVTEIDRQTPNKNHWAIENGDQPKGKPSVDWDNL